MLARHCKVPVPGSSDFYILEFILKFYMSDWLKKIGMSGFMTVGEKIVIPKEETTHGWGEESCCQAWKDHGCHLH